MLKSCSYCGRIHQRNYQCPNKPKRLKQPTYIDKFRWSKPWQKKRKHINERDKHMCQICIRGLYQTQIKYNFTNIEVHHIDSLIENWNRRLDDDNLLCLCSTHHKMAECGNIPKEKLFEIVVEQQNKNN